jgi:hypothetical protein
MVVLNPLKRDFVGINYQWQSPIEESRKYVFYTHPYPMHVSLDRDNHPSTFLGIVNSIEEAQKVVDFDVSNRVQLIYERIQQRGDIKWQSGIVPESQPNQVLLIELVDNSDVTMAFGREDSSWVFESVNITSGALHSISIHG